MKVKFKKALAMLMTLTLVVTAITFMNSGTLKAANEEAQVDGTTPVEEIVDGDVEVKQENEGTTQEANLSLDKKKSSNDVSYQAEVNDKIKVEAVAEEGTFSGKVELGVDLLDKTEKKEAEKLLEEQNVQFDGFLPIDLSFANSKSEQEPNGVVGFSMEISKDLISEGADLDSLTLVHYEQDAKTGEVKNIVEVKNADIDVKKNVVAVDFSVDSLSTFALTWNGNNSDKLNIHVVDTAKNGIGQDITFDIESETTVNKLADNEKIGNYSFGSAVLLHSGTTSLSKGTIFTEIRKNNGTWQVYTHTVQNKEKEPVKAWTNVVSTDSLYFIYKDDKMGSLTPAGSGSGGGDKDLGEPKTSKTLTANKGTGTPNDFSKGDGTYNLALSVTGKTDEVRSTPEADVIIILDNSSSMHSKREMHITPDGHERIDEAIPAVKTLISNLLKNNTSKGEIRVSLIRFANKAIIDVDNSFNQATLKTAVDNGTNWEDGLIKVSDLKNLRENVPKYVIFVSDGNPTMHYSPCGKAHGSQGDRDVTSEDWNSGRGAYGTAKEYEPNMTNCYNWSIEEAKKIANAGYEFYGLAIYGFLDRMNSIVNEATGSTANSYQIENQEQLNDVFNTIISSISKEYKYKNVVLHDSITSLTSTVGDGAVVGDFRYSYKDTDGWHTWDKAPAANYNDETGEVTWDLSKVEGEDFTLADGVEYKVEFTVWPGQRAYDIWAAIQNKDIEYGDTDALVNGEKVTADEWGQLNEDGTLKSNVYEHKDGTSKDCSKDKDKSYVDYKSVTIVDGEETSEKSGTTFMTNPDPMPLAVAKLNVEKLWQDITGAEYANPPESIKLNLLQDGTKIKELTLNKDDDYKTSLFISTGLMVNEGEYGSDEETGILEPGHVYSLTEDTTGTRYTFTTDKEGVHPLLDGTTTSTMTDMIDAVTGAAFGASATIKGTNKYTPNPTEATIVGLKSMSGRELNAGEFSFTLTDSNGTVLQTVSNTVDPQNKKQGTFSFSKIQYTAVGDYTYTVKEVIPTPKANGVSYDESTYTVTVKVTKNAETNDLQSEVVYAKGGNAVERMQFSNVYTPDPTSAQFNGKKVLQGRPLKEGEFSFVLKDASEKQIGETVTNNADGTFTFDAISFDKAGTYNYTISEVVPDGAKDGVFDGVKYDESVINVEVTVSKNATTGNLSATTTYKDGDNTVDLAAFENTYLPKPTTAQFNGKKVLQGRPLKEGEFSFVLKDASEKQIGETVTNNADGTFTFDAISFDKAGTYNYTISEVKPDEDKKIDRVTYDESVIDVTVTVTKDTETGDLVATTIYKDGNNKVDLAAFENTYLPKPTTAQFNGKKVLQGRSLKEGEFSFVLKDASEKQIGETVTNNADGTFTFDAINYDVDDLEGADSKTFNYTISEVVPDDAEDGVADGVTYDTGVINVEVTVSKNATTGDLQTDVVYKDGNNEVTLATFENSYIPSPVKAVIEGKKSLSGRTLQEGEFSFELKDSEGTVLDEVKNAEDGTFSFEELSYSREDLGEATSKTFTYTVNEVIPEKKDKHLTYDETVYTVTVLVKYDASTGEMSKTVTYSDGSDTTEEIEFAEFNNEYTPDPGKAVIAGLKVLNGRPLEEGEFSFELKDSKGTHIETVENDADSSFTFTELEFNKNNVDAADKTFTYTVNEVIPEDVADKRPGVAYDENVYTVKITAHKNATTGNITVDEPVYENGGKAVETMQFTNDYKPADTSIVIEGLKVLNGKALNAEDFSFELKDSKGTLIETVKNDANGNFKFKAISYKQKDLEGAASKTFTYTVNEVVNDEDGTIVYDESIKTVKVVVTDNTAEAKLVAEIDESSDEVKFTNAYKASAVIEGLKVLNGKALNAEDFSFELKDSKGTLIETVKNDASGNFKFSAIEYTEEGTYKYTVNEVIPADEDKLEGVEYDETSYNVTVKVAMNDESGKLEATVDPSKSELKFVNEFKASAVIGGNKILTGLDLDENQFMFELCDDNGDVVRTATNNADGEFAFEPIFFTEDEIGTYTYTVREVEPQLKMNKVANVKYDKSEYEVKIIVAMDEETGELKAEVRPPEGGLVFTNIGLTNFKIIKTLKNYELQEGYLEDTAALTFAFDVKVEFQGETVLSDVYAVSFSDTGVKEVAIDDVPIGAKITVTELNSGVTYSADAAQQSIELVKDSAANKIEFINQYDGRNDREHGALNTFTKNGDSWSGKQIKNY